MEKNTINDDHLICIGVPVRNGAKTIRKTLDSILNQTYKKFHLIISDNVSNDDTVKICLEYSQVDSRITLIQQNENIGWYKNFLYLVQKSTTEYFVWLSADDYWEPDFLQKNIDALENNPSFVGSISKIDYYDIDIQNNQEKVEWIKSKSKQYDEYSNFSKYQDRVSFYLRLNSAENMFGLFRTDIFKKCVQKCFEKERYAMDDMILLLIQRFGKINLVNETLLHRSVKGRSSTRKKDGASVNNIGTVGKPFPLLTYAYWIFMNLGPRIFFKNINYILFTNVSVLSDYIQRVNPLPRLRHLLVCLCFSILLVILSFYYLFINS
jgi:glycosyltransferase involved in cell wall biosynthesis